MYSFKVIHVSPNPESKIHRKAELKNLTTGETQYIFFKEHDADKSLISATFTDESFNTYTSVEILRATNGHNSSELAENDILEPTYNKELA